VELDLDRKPPVEETQAQLGYNPPRIILKRQIPPPTEEVDEEEETPEEIPAVQDADVEIENDPNASS